MSDLETLCASLARRVSNEPNSARLTDAALLLHLAQARIADSVDNVDTVADQLVTLLGRHRHAVTQARASQAALQEPKTFAQGGRPTDGPATPGGESV